MYNLFFWLFWYLGIKQMLGNFLSKAPRWLAEWKNISYLHMMNYRKLSWKASYLAQLLPPFNGLCIMLLLGKIGEKFPTQRGFVPQTQVNPPHTSPRITYLMASPVHQAKAYNFNSNGSLFQVHDLSFTWKQQQRTWLIIRRFIPWLMLKLQHQERL